MAKITSASELRERIQQLEIKQVEDMRLMKEQLLVTYESMKPYNIIKSSVKDFAQSPNLKGDVINATLGLAAGYLSKKVVIGSTHNPIKKVLGAFLELAISNAVSKNSEGIKSTLVELLDSFLKRNKASSE